MNKSRTVIRRHQYADYLNVGTADAAKWVLMGTGFTTLDEEPGAQTESVKYVNEVSSSSSIVSIMWAQMLSLNTAAWSFGTRQEQPKTPGILSRPVNLW